MEGSNYNRLLDLLILTMIPPQTFSYLSDNVPAKENLLKAFKGKPVELLRTPALILDRAIFAKNCALMYDAVKTWNADFRAHVKTHKTREGVVLQLQISGDKKTSAIVVSTIMEGQEIIRMGLVHEGIVKDMLFGLPVALNKLAELADMADVLEAHQSQLRLLVDHPQQVRALEEYNQLNGRKSPWSVFVKIEVGTRRAGVDPGSPRFKDLLQTLFFSSAVSVYGFYSLGSQSYKSTSLLEVSDILNTEILTVNNAAMLAKDIYSSMFSKNYGDVFVLAVGSTPTAHALQEPTEEIAKRLESVLHGRLEIHAGNYPVLDLQQMYTTLIGPQRVAQVILSTVLSYYPGRGNDGEDEALCDAGAIAMSKDSGPSGGFGDVVGKDWRLERVSQEHGILVKTLKEGSPLEIGSVIRIIPQHACLTAANHPWYYIVDSEIGKDNEVVDIWVPWKGW